MSGFVTVEPASEWADALMGDDSTEASGPLISGEIGRLDAGFSFVVSPALPEAPMSADDVLKYERTRHMLLKRSEPVVIMKGRSVGMSTCHWQGTHTWQRNLRTLFSNAQDVTLRPPLRETGVMAALRGALPALKA